MAPAPCPEVGKVEICLVGGRAISSRDGSGPPFPNAAFGVPRPAPANPGGKFSSGPESGTILQYTFPPWRCAADTWRVPEEALP